MWNENFRYRKFLEKIDQEIVRACTWKKRIDRTFFLGYYVRIIYNRDVTFVVRKFLENCYFRLLFLQNPTIPFRHSIIIYNYGKGKKTVEDSFSLGKDRTCTSLFSPSRVVNPSRLSLGRTSVNNDVNFKERARLGTV